MASTTAETMDAHACAECGTREGDGTELKTCNACKMARYCSRDCQVSHWPRHKETCKKRAAELFDKELFKDPPEREECPICMLPLPFDEKSMVLFQCCGTFICKGCVHGQFKEDINNGKEYEECQACAFCRTPAPKDVIERIHRVNKNVERNHARSMNQLACYYRDGMEGVQKDMAKSIELFEKSGKLGYANSYFCLGDIYCVGGDGIERDTKKARHYYELGTIGGSIHARYHLSGLDWDDGNFTRAFKHCLICAKAGLKEPLEALKIGCKKGYVTKDEYAQALRAYQKQHEATRSETREEFSRIEQGDVIADIYVVALLAHLEEKHAEAASATRGEAPVARKVADTKSKAAIQS